MKATTRVQLLLFKVEKTEHEIFDSVQHHHIIIFFPFFLSLFYCVDGDSTTNQRWCNHGRWLEANRQSYTTVWIRTRSLSAPDGNSILITINPEKGLLWDPDPGPSSPSGTYA